jgi:heat-inducible transcriptional repressor
MSVGVIIVIFLNGKMCDWWAGAKQNIPERVVASPPSRPPLPGSRSPRTRYRVSASSPAHQAKGHGLNADAEYLSDPLEIVCTPAFILQLRANRLTSKSMSSAPPQPHPVFSVAQLDQRARDIFRQIVETYLETGEPVGSRTLARQDGMVLSPASIRNTMQDLTELGLLAAPHISAGRLPTHQGLRIFVDGLLEVGAPSAEDRASIEAALKGSPARFDDLLARASDVLSGLAGGAGLVTSPTRDAEIRQIEFVPLSSGDALAVIAFSDGAVENRLIRLPKGTPGTALTAASNFLSAQMAGHTLGEARRRMAGEIDRARAELDAVASRLVDAGVAAWSGHDDDRSLIVRGQANLLRDSTGDDLERVRQLFVDLERKEDLIRLLDSTRSAAAVKIFIGAENPLFSLSGSSVIAAPYLNEQQRVIGALGVIGPTRLNYGRIIPLVDYTARVVSELMDRSRREG